MINNLIFIQIPSYRDSELLSTIKDCINKAKYPENLRFAIAWQHSNEDDWDNIDLYKHDDRFQILDIDYKDSLGVCWARSLIQKLYNNEKYILQIDSHHRFAQDWDEFLITTLDQLIAEGYEKPILTAYVPPYYPEKDIWQNKTYPPMKIVFDKYHADDHIICKPALFDSQDKTSNKPIKAKFYSGHFAFALGEFIKDVPYDPDYYFYREEINIGARAFTSGYDMFHPHKSVITHFYTRPQHRKHWDDHDYWIDHHFSCSVKHKCLLEIGGLKCNNYDYKGYELGKIRTLQEYKNYCQLTFDLRSYHKGGKVGTALKDLLSKIGINASPNCSCASRARLMDGNGIEWCENNIDIIVGWLREEATKRNLPFIDYAGKLLVLKAIKNAKRDLSH